MPMVFYIVQSFLSLISNRFVKSFGAYDDSWISWKSSWNWQDWPHGWKWAQHMLCKVSQKNMISNYQFRRNMSFHTDQVSVATIIQLFGVLRRRIPGKHLPSLVFNDGIPWNQKNTIRKNAKTLIPVVEHGPGKTYETLWTESLPQIRMPRTINVLFGAGWRDNHGGKCSQNLLST